jgi:hypothetical protein
MATSRTPGVSEFFREYADPILAAHRFTKKGRTYRRGTDNGDTAVVEFQASPGASPESYVFFINLAVVPVPWLRWLERRAPHPESVEVKASHGLYDDRLRADDALGRWVIDSVESGHARGRQLAELLPARLDEMASLLDRREFLRRLREGPKLPRSDTAVEIILLLDDGPLEELEPLLVQMENGAGSGPRFAAWAREWARNHRTQTQ